MQSRERLPFFKPLQQDQSMRSTSQQAQSFFAPIQHSQQILESESFRMNQEQQEGTRLTSLHGRLQQEADKIRKWKTHTEMELKQKDKMITEGKRTIESLRKSILEMQLQNENLSLKMKEEIDNRNEIQQKIESTRDMCNLLKDHTSKVDQQLSICETERTELKYLEKEHAKQFDELTSQFNRMEISTHEICNKLTNDVYEKDVENKKLSELYASDMDKAKSEIDSLMQNMQTKAMELQALSEELENSNKQITIMQTELGGCQTTLQETECAVLQKIEEVESHQDQINKLMGKNTELETSLKDVTEQLMNATKEHDKSVKTYEETLKELGDKKDVVQETLDKERSRYKDLETNYRKSLISAEGLKSDKDILIMEKAEALDKIKELKETEKNLLDTKEDLENQITELHKDIDKKQGELDEQNEKIKTLEASVLELKETVDEHTQCIEKLSADYEESANRLSSSKINNTILEEKLSESVEVQKELNDQIQTLNDQLNAQNDSAAEMEACLQALAKEKDMAEKELSILTKEISKLKKDLDKSKNKEIKSQANIEELTKQKLNVLKEKEALIETNQADMKQKEKELDEAQSKVQELEDELQHKEEDLTHLSTRSVEAKNDTTAKNKHIKELEKEVRSLKSKLTSQTKRMTTQENEYKSIQDDVKSMEDAKNATEAQMEVMKEEIELANEKVTKMTDEVKQEQKIAIQSVKDKENAKKEFDSKMKEMIALLEKFKDENQKIVAAKEDEIEQLKKQANKSQDDNKLKKENMDIKKELDSLTILIETIKSEKLSLEKTSLENQKRIKSMEAEIKSKENTIKEMQESNLTKPATPKPNSQIPATPKVKQTSMEPASNVHKASTPRTPRMSNLAVVKAQPIVKEKKTPVTTPKLVPCTPQNRKTPLGGIMRQANSVPKKRRVMFSSENCSDDNVSDSGESSTSELMEVEVDNISSRKMVSKPSPSLRFSPNVSRNSTQSVYSGKSVSRQKPAKKGKPTKESKETKEFRRLFPNDNDDDLFRGTENKGLMQSPSPAKVRKSITKSPGKFFKSASRLKSPSSQSKNRKEGNLNWFDCDSIFGFGTDENEP